MKHFKVLVLCFCLLFMGCSSISSSQAKGIDFTRYKYVTISNIMSYTGSPYLMQVEVEISNTLEQSRLILMGDRELGNLTNEQRQQLLEVKFSASVSYDFFWGMQKAGIAVNFIDYTTGRSVNSMSVTSMSLTQDSAINSAISKLNKELFNYL